MHCTCNGQFICFFSALRPSVAHSNKNNKIYTVLKGINSHRCLIRNSDSFSHTDEPTRFTYRTEYTCNLRVYIRFVVADNANCRCRDMNVAQQQTETFGRNPNIVFCFICTHTHTPHTNHLIHFHPPERLKTILRFSFRFLIRERRKTEKKKNGLPDGNDGTIHHDDRIMDSNLN